jgi:hypothetical protein
MKSWVLVYLLLFPAIIYGKGKHKVLIHEPSNDKITSLVLNTEFDQYKDYTYTNTILTLSTQTGWDISLLSQNIPTLIQNYDNQPQSYQDDTYMMVTKSFTYDAHNITLSSQAGYQLYNGISGKMHQFYFIDYEYTYDSFVKFHYGQYYVNSSLSTTKNYIGELGGISLKLSKQFEFQVDTISDKSNVSGTQYTIWHYPRADMGIYTAIYIPTPNSGNYSYYGIGASISTTSLSYY